MHSLQCIATAQQLSKQSRVMQDGGIDHFKMTLRNGAVRKPAERLKVRKKVEHFWYSLTMAAHTQGIDVLELLDPVCDFCILLCACGLLLSPSCYCLLMSDRQKHALWKDWLECMDSPHDRVQDGQFCGCHYTAISRYPWENESNDQTAAIFPVVAHQRYRKGMLECDQSICTPILGMAWLLPN